MDLKKAKKMRKIEEKNKRELDAINESEKYFTNKFGKIDIQKYFEEKFINGSNRFFIDYDKSSYKDSKPFIDTLINNLNANTSNLVFCRRELLFCYYIMFTPTKTNNKKYKKLIQYYFENDVCIICTILLILILGVSFYMRKFV